MTFRQLICLLAFTLLPLSAREWTNDQGRTIQADFVSSDGKSVVLKIGGKKFICSLASLSQADRAFVAAQAEKPVPSAFEDPQPKRYQLKARASKIDPRCKSHPKIGFLLEDAKGKPADTQQACVDTRVAPRGELVIWLMAPNDKLFKELNAMGYHVIQPHYARQWFGIICQQNPVAEDARGNARLEAATGRDFSDEMDLDLPDGMMERSYQLVRWLSKENPQGKWEQFLTSGGLNWDKVVMSGISHGSTTAARFAKHQKVARVVAFSGPRDQFQNWQALPSATPENRYFGFTHVLDEGWAGSHYCRSWQMLGLANFGPVVNVDTAKPPYGHTRRLITAFDVNNDPNRAHNSVIPNNGARKSADGSWAHREVWQYLVASPVEAVGDAVPPDPSCRMNHR